MKTFEHITRDCIFNLKLSYQQREVAKWKARLDGWTSRDSMNKRDIEAEIMKHEVKIAELILAR